MTAPRCRIHPFVLLVLSVLGALLATPTPGAAQRGGFIIGIGAGPGYVSFPGSPERTSKVTVATDFKIGYAPSEAWSIYWSQDTNFYSLDDDLPGSEDVILALFGVGGIGVTRFLDTDAPVSYVDGSLGLGNSAIIFDDGEAEQDAGLGLTVGTGLALTDVVFLDLDLVYSRISPDFGDSRAYYGAKVSINVLSN